MAHRHPWGYPTQCRVITPRGSCKTESIRASRLEEGPQCEGSWGLERPTEGDNQRLRRKGSDPKLAKVLAGGAMREVDWPADELPNPGVLQVLV